MNSNREAKPTARRARQATRATGKTRPPALPASALPPYDELLRFFNESPDLLCIAGFDGRFKRLNPAWHAALGWTVAQLQARPFLDFVLPDDRQITRAEMARLATGTATITFENRYHCEDGSYK